MTTRLRPFRLGRVPREPSRNRRRLIAVLVTGALALAGLAGCRSEPAVAAYVGETRITESQVNEVVESVRNLAPAENLAQIRQFAVTMLILRTAGTDYARSQDITVPAPDVEAMAEASGLPEDSRYAVLLAEFNAVLRALTERARSADPTEADQREAYANLQTNGQSVPPFEDVRQYFSAEVMGQPVGQRNLLGQVVERADIVVNPKYGPLTYRVQMVVGQVETWLSVPLTDHAANPVADNRTTDTR